MTKTYIIVYTDGAMSVRNHKPIPSDYNKNMVRHIFESNDNTPIIELCELQARYFDYPSKFKEIQKGK